MSHGTDLDTVLRYHSSKVIEQWADYGYEDMWFLTEPDWDVSTFMAQHLISKPSAEEYQAARERIEARYAKLEEAREIATYLLEVPL